MRRMKDKNTIPILEFDPSPSSIIEPGRHGRDIRIPERCVMTFFGEVVSRFAKLPSVEIAGTSRWESGNVDYYVMEYKGENIAFFHSQVGAPVAVGLMEYAVAHGAKKIIACGGCGVLDASIAVGNILVPIAAVRDEGTSYHYLQANREVYISESGVNAITKILERHELDYIKCKTWTTDAVYRETLAKASHRKEEGCLCVEMECSALAAAAEFRGVQFAQVLYGGDCLDGIAYDERSWWEKSTVREKLFMLALEACLEYD